ncbi:MAG: helix-turn-helix domain-containing protein [Desulfarculaceae bacterium]|nr:helix-turn-helix domain-containing protein [Desulfarculaceae bacterium]
MSKGNGYVTSGQMAEALGCSRRNISRYCLDGLFPGAFRTMGGHWRIPKKYFSEAKGEKGKEDRPVPDQTGQPGQPGQTGQPGQHPVDGT